jgi:2,3-diaminopropionate biosynthesis protein SbnB
MSDDTILLLKAGEVLELLNGREEDVIDAVQRAYETHTRGQSSLPHSSFLRFGEDSPDRIICLPAYLGGESEVAGMKWVASVPGNVKKGMPRASAVVVLNARETGRPTAILEGSIISARRTAASAALGARVLHTAGAPEAIGFVGCGLINFEIARFLLTVFPDVKKLGVYDLDIERARSLAESLSELRADAVTEAVGSLDELLARSSVTAFATTAVVPYVKDLSPCPQDATILHISLRDLAPELLLANDNVVDDYDHVNRAQTSVHLASEITGNGDFVRGSIGEVLLGSAPAKAEDAGLSIYTPFGLGVLDMAVSELVCNLARKEGAGTVIESFLP